MSTSVLIANEFHFFSNKQKFLEIRHNSWFDSSKSTSNTNFPANIDEVFKRKQYKNTQKNLKKKKKIPNDFVWDILSFQLAIFSASLSLPPTLRNWPHGTDLTELTCNPWFQKLLYLAFRGRKNRRFVVRGRCHNRWRFFSLLLQTPYQRF